MRSAGARPTEVSGGPWVNAVYWFDSGKFGTHSTMMDLQAGVHCEFQIPQLWSDIQNPLDQPRVEPRPTRARGAQLMVRNHETRAQYEPVAIHPY